MQQEFLFNTDVTVHGALEQFQIDTKLTVKPLSFIRWELSEGVEKIDSNLVADVEELLKGSKQ